MFTALATTITAWARLVADWTSISIFAQRLSRHRVCRAERRGAREQDIEVVDELRLPARFGGANLRRTEEPWMMERDPV